MMTPKEIDLLAKACRMAGIDATKITPANPFEKSGGTAGLLQAAVAELNPVQAAKWRVAAGSSLSLATMAELQSGEPLSEAAQRDLYEHDAQFVADVQRQQQNAEELALKEMEQQAAEMRFRNTLRRAGGNEHAAKRMIEAEDAAEAQRQQQLQALRGAN